jgi:hypothetical protein
LQPRWNLLPCPILGSCANPSNNNGLWLEPRAQVPPIFPPQVARRRHAANSYIHTCELTIQLQPNATAQFTLLHCTARQPSTKFPFFAVLSPVTAPSPSSAMSLVPPIRATGFASQWTRYLSRLAVPSALDKFPTIHREANSHGTIL